MKHQTINSAANVSPVLGRVLLGTWWCASSKTDGGQQASTHLLPYTARAAPISEK